MSRLNFNLIKKIRNIFFPFYRNSDLKFVFKKLQQGFPDKPKVAMFVGGCVRKHLSNEEIDDIDIATSLTTDQIKEKFKDTKFNIIDSGLKHGTVTLVYDQLKLELTTLRKDVKTDGRHAEIEYTDDWYKDSERRDFTINTLAIRLNKNYFGELIDTFGGIDDIEKGIIKTPSEPNMTFSDDPLRMLRAIRFSCELNFDIDCGPS